MDAIFQLGLQGVIAYGAVGITTIILKKRFNVDLDSDVKLSLLIGIAFVVGFVPADLGNMILNRIKDAVAVGVTIHSGNTIINKLRPGNV